MPTEEELYALDESDIAKIQRLLDAWDSGRFNLPQTILPKPESTALFTRLAQAMDSIPGIVSNSPGYGSCQIVMLDDSGQIVVSPAAAIEIVYNISPEPIAIGTFIAITRDPFSGANIVSQCCSGGYYPSTSFSGPASFSGGGGGGGGGSISGGGGYLTTCCDDSLIPAVLYATVRDPCIGQVTVALTFTGLAVPFPAWVYEGGPVNGGGCGALLRAASMSLCDPSTGYSFVYAGNPNDPAPCTAIPIGGGDVQFAMSCDPFFAMFSGTYSTTDYGCPCCNDGTWSFSAYVTV